MFQLSQNKSFNRFSFYTYLFLNHWISPNARTTFYFCYCWTLVSLEQIKRRFERDGLSQYPGANSVKRFQVTFLLRNIFLRFVSMLPWVNCIIYMVVQFYTFIYQSNYLETHFLSWGIPLSSVTDSSICTRSLLHAVTYCVLTR